MFSHLEFPEDVKFTCDNRLPETSKGSIIDQLAESATVYSACSAFSALSGNSDEHFHSTSCCSEESDEEDEETEQTKHLITVIAATA